MLNKPILPVSQWIATGVAEINTLDTKRDGEEAKHVVVGPPALPPEKFRRSTLKIRELVRRSFYVTAVTLLCFGPGAFALSPLANPVSAPSFTNSVGVFIFNPLGEDRDKKKRKVAASEGGSAALYLMFAGLACGSAVLLRSRRTIAPKSV